MTSILMRDLPFRRRGGVGGCSIVEGGISYQVVFLLEEKGREKRKLSRRKPNIPIQEEKTLLD